MSTMEMRETEERDTILRPTSQSLTWNKCETERKASLAWKQQKCDFNPEK